jgi:hypothetical protein
VGDGWIVWRLDRYSRLIFVNEAWRRSANEFRHPQLGNAILGKTLCSQISDPHIACIYQNLLIGIQHSHEDADFLFSCDDAEWHRDMEMRVTPLPDGGVEFTLRALAIHPPLDFKPPALSVGLLLVCSWCCRALVAGTWMSLGAAIQHYKIFQRGVVTPSTSHGICPDCAMRWNDGVTVLPL